MNRKREAELTQLRKDFDTQTEEHEKTVADFRKKQAAAIGEMEEQVATLQKSKSKLEKERQALTAENGDLSSQLDDVQKAKVSYYTTIMDGIINPPCIGCFNCRLSLIEK